MEWKYIGSNNNIFNNIEQFKIIYLDIIWLYRMHVKWIMFPFYSWEIKKSFKAADSRWAINKQVIWGSQK